MKKVLFSLLFLQMMGGMKAQSLDEYLQWSVQAEEIIHCPEDSVLYAGAVVMNIATGDVVAMTNLCQKSSDGCKGQFAACFLPSQEKHAVVVYIWGKVDKGYSNPSNLARKRQSIKHRDDWLHPSAR